MMAASYAQRVTMSPVSILAFVSVTLVIASASRVPYSATNTAFTDVTSKDQLWRFLVGDGVYLTVGDRYICLHTYRNHFLAATSRISLVIGYTCQVDERFEIEFVSENEVVLKSKRYHQYVSCDMDGQTRTTDWRDESAIFQLKISPDEDEIVLYNPYVDGTLTTQGGHITCNGYQSQAASKFHGWKLGPREAWEASDEWQLIGYFDNRYSSSKTEFAYATSVGTERSFTLEGRVSDRDRAQPGPDMHDVFTKSISGKSDVAWDITPPNVWSETTSLKSSIDVAPHTLTKLYQAVGHYGVFTIRTNYIQARDEETKEPRRLEILKT